MEEFFDADDEVRRRGGCMPFVVISSVGLQLLTLKCRDRVDAELCGNVLCPKTLGRRRRDV